MHDQHVPCRALASTLFLAVIATQSPQRPNLDDGRQWVDAKPSLTADSVRLPPSRRSGVGPHDEPPTTGRTCRNAVSRTATVTRRKGRR
jgi:hypothetical protein